jgi:hypothetical protein
MVKELATLNVERENGKEMIYMGSYSRLNVPIP